MGRTWFSSNIILYEDTIHHCKQADLFCNFFHDQSIIFTVVSVKSAQKSKAGPSVEPRWRRGKLEGTWTVRLGLDMDCDIILALHYATDQPGELTRTRS